MGRNNGEFSVGMTIFIRHLEGENKNYDGRTGIITHIDDAGQLHGTWGGLAVIPEIDDFEVYEKDRN